MTIYQGHGWVHDRGEWYPDHDTGTASDPIFFEVWAPPLFPEIPTISVKWYRRNLDMRGVARQDMGMIGADWDVDREEWEWRDDLTA